MSVSMLPKELRDDPNFEKSMELLTDEFYKLMKEGGETALKATGAMDGDVMGVVFKTIIANMCKEAFNDAYVRYLSGS